MRRVSPFAALLLVACSRPTPADGPDPSTPPSSSSPTSQPTSTPTPTGTPDERSPLDVLLDEAYRIDPSHIDVVLDVTPTAATLDGSATITFTMRPGADRAAFHFSPFVQGADPRGTLTALALDGDALDPTDDADLLPVELDGSRQAAFEIGRDLGPGEHTLELAWTIPNVSRAVRRDWFLTLVDDTVGNGNDKLWPTVNAPEALARHTVAVRIHDPRDYTFVGSGLADGPVVEADGAQVWTVDTVREVASYTVMLVAAPAAELDVRRFDVGDVPVTLASTEPVDRTDDAERLIGTTLGALEADFGAFPMPALGVVLLDWPDGMEYYGATITGLSSLSHELVHMYWGCSAVNRTWRDTWLDEAINVWIEVHGRMPTLPDGYTADLVSGRTELQLGFDGRAYHQGAMMFDRVAERMGGPEPLFDFLRAFRDDHVFVPYTTEELVDALVAETGDPAYREDFDRWVFGGP